jgi:hypothetical protein
MVIRTILPFDVERRLKILVIRDPLEAFVVYIGHLGFEVIQKRLHGAVQNAEHFFGFIYIRLAQN